MMLYQDYIPQKELVVEQGLDKEVAEGGSNCVRVGGCGAGMIVCSGNSGGVTPTELRNWACCWGT